MVMQLFDYAKNPFQKLNIMVCKLHLSWKKTQQHTHTKQQQQKEHILILLLLSYIE